MTTLHVAEPPISFLLAGGITPAAEPVPAATFTCPWRDFEYPLEPQDDEDESVWCECGLRGDQQRELLQAVAA